MLFFLIVAFLYNQCQIISACPPQGAGNCYAGQFSGGPPRFSNQKCAQDGLSEWCAVTYQPAYNLANFGCASSFSQQLGMPTCGDSSLSINQQGCNKVNTANGPCYLCCCKGGSCNHPQVFAQQAQYAFGDTFPNQHMIGLTGSASLNCTWLLLVTFLLALLIYAV